MSWLYKRYNQLIVLRVRLVPQQARRHVVQTLFKADTMGEKKTAAGHLVYLCNFKHCWVCEHTDATYRRWVFSGSHLFLSLWRTHSQNRWGTYPSSQFIFFLNIFCNSQNSPRRLATNWPQDDFEPNADFHRIPKMLSWVLLPGRAPLLAELRHCFWRVACVYSQSLTGPFGGKLLPWISFGRQIPKKKKKKLCGLVSCILVQTHPSLVSFTYLACSCLSDPY